MITDNKRYKTLKFYLRWKASCIIRYDNTIAWGQIHVNSPTPLSTVDLDTRAFSCHKKRKTLSSF